MRIDILFQLSIALMCLASVVTSQGPCSKDSDCPSDHFIKQYCNKDRCMPTECTGVFVKGCQGFDKRTYCPALTGAVKCAPRLEAGKNCTWTADFEEQPCAAGLVCTGIEFQSMTCVLGGKGPLAADGKPLHPVKAAASAAEKPDDSIPPRPMWARRTTTTKSTTTTGPTPTDQGSALPTSDDSMAVPKLAEMEIHTGPSWPLVAGAAVAGCAFLGAVVGGHAALARRHRARFA